MKGWTDGRTDGRTDGPGGGNHKATMRRGKEDEERTDARWRRKKTARDGLGAASAACGSVSVNLT